MQLAARCTLLTTLSPGRPGALSFPCEGPYFMIAVLVELDFACSACGANMGVTLKCAGPGLASGGAHLAAQVHVPCPHCSKMNQVIFEPSGLVLAVRPCEAVCGIPEPSLN
jgi:hypothetical protein